MESNIDAVLSAKSFFGVLGLPNELCSVSNVKKAYRRLALLIHPDKCNHASAKAAFQRLSEAYDSLNSETAQRRYLSFSETKHVEPPKQKNRRRWWENTSFADFERRWKRREEADQAMRSSFVSSMSQKFGQRKLVGQMIAIEKATEQLDGNASLSRNELWPPLTPDEEADTVSFLPGGSKPTAMKDSYLPRSERPELEDTEYVSQRFADTMGYLRDEHHYCFWCGSAYSCDTELQRVCPGITEQCHEESSGGAAGASSDSIGANGSNTAASTAVEVHAADPLDAFMAGIQTEVSEQKTQDSARWAKKKRQGQDANARSKGGNSGRKKHARWGGWD
jgi:curved DNA-binding protein CbpA